MVSPLSLAVYRQPLVLEVVLQPEQGELRLVPHPLLPEAESRPQDQPLVILGVNHGVRGLCPVSLVLNLQGVVTIFPALKFITLKFYKLQHAPHLKGGGRLELVLTSVSVLSIRVSVVIEVSTPLRTRFLMFLCGNDLITRTGMVID